MSYNDKRVDLDIVMLNDEQYVKITNSDDMRPFFMNVVSDSNHWLFVSSNGGITAGRKNPELALFPYYTVDKITESSEYTGSKTILQIHTSKGDLMWEPFRHKYSNRYKINRNIYKNISGNKVVFEEINHDLELTYRYHWNTSNIFGFVKKAELINNSDRDISITILDGLQNIMPYGISSDLQRAASNLGDAYKRNELEPNTGMGIYSLSAMIVDKAEPSEALKANVVWSLGFDNPIYLLSSLQIDNFRKGFEIKPEKDIKGEKGAFFTISDIIIKANSTKNWKIVANVNQSHSNIVDLSKSIQANSDIEKDLEEDINIGTERLTKFVSSADGIQLTADHLSDIRHYSNVLFNIMRGGIFDDNYIIEKDDFIDYLKNANSNILEKYGELINGLDEKIHREHLKEIVLKQNDSDLYRLAIEYLPLKFSRRHGDPSRPWNNFTINTRDEQTGKKILDYEGNWRDLFQNWEALAHSYPEYIDGMIFKFLNASTFDGYNPYRITKKGFDWETIEPDNPWSYIGYWGDHQVIYLLKFLEIAENYYPNLLEGYFNKNLFVYAEVPYIIKPYDQILENPRDTILFDDEWDSKIRKRREKLGADGALISIENSEVYKVNFIEKILAVVLSKMSNFIPEAGIWMNTQRPEWNDANNALVGNGVSMVTLYYLRRFLSVFKNMLENANIESVDISSELKVFYTSIEKSFAEHSYLLTDKINDVDRKKILDSLGKAASDYRGNIYKNGFSGEKENVSLQGLIKFATESLSFIDHSINQNKRSDNLYHSYNLMSSNDTKISITHLSEMLEGQVAVLSSGKLTAEESLEVLTALRNSSMYRADQNSYILYPNKELAGFLDKNNIPHNRVEASKLFGSMLQDNYFGIIEKDINGDYHFNGNFRNAKDLESALENLHSSKYSNLIADEKALIEGVFEEVFNHKSFTGRSSTFFAYEGLGSIYWHMVSKLLLATQECLIKSMKADSKSEVSLSLLKRYFEIKEGIGLHKSPELYGAFPTDPYSHTPMHRGAQQPGMTGQVKEDILVNMGELGLEVIDGELNFNPKFLRRDLFLTENQVVKCANVSGEINSLEVDSDSMFFSYCQVPVIYKISDNKGVVVNFNNGKSLEYNSLKLEKDISMDLFKRHENISNIVVSIPEEFLLQINMSSKIVKL